MHILYISNNCLCEVNSFIHSPLINFNNLVCCKITDVRHLTFSIFDFSIVFKILRIFGQNKIFLKHSHDMSHLDWTGIKLTIFRQISIY